MSDNLIKINYYQNKNNDFIFPILKYIEKKLKIKK
jgi:hypothetical protein